MRFWTAERTETLITLHAEGKTYTEIALALANGCTRGKVSGKVDRLGLGARVPRAFRQTVPRTPKKREEVMTEDVSPGTIEPESLRIAISDVRDSQCRYIASDPQVDSSCCGHPVFRGSLCDVHFARCYDIVSTKRYNEKVLAAREDRRRP